MQAVRLALRSRRGQEPTRGRGPGRHRPASRSWPARRQGADPVQPRGRRSSSRRASRAASTSGAVATCRRPAGDRQHAAAARSASRSQRPTRSAPSAGAGRLAAPGEGGASRPGDVRRDAGRSQLPGNVAPAGASLQRERDVLAAGEPPQPRAQVRTTRLFGVVVLVTGIHVGLLDDEGGAGFVTVHRGTRAGTGAVRPAMRR